MSDRANSSYKRTGTEEQTAEKRSLALQLRKDGHSYTAIARLLATQWQSRHPRSKTDKFSAMYAHKLVRQAIKEIYREDAVELVKIEMDRLDDMQLEALTVLRNKHVVVSAGQIVLQNVRGEEGKWLIDAVTGFPLAVPIVDDGPRLAAIDRLLKIQERRSKLLGLDKPTKVASTNPEGDKPAQPFIIVASKEDQAL